MIDGKAASKPHNTLKQLEALRDEIAEVKGDYLSVCGGTFADWQDDIDTIINQMKAVEPSQEQIQEGAKALVSWDDDCVWPDSWSDSEVIRARNDARRVYMAMCTTPPNTYTAEQVHGLVDALDALLTAANGKDVPSVIRVGLMDVESTLTQFKEQSE